MTNLDLEIEDIHEYTGKGMVHVDPICNKLAQLVPNLGRLVHLWDDYSQRVRVAYSIRACYTGMWTRCDQRYLAVTWSP